MVAPSDSVASSSSSASSSPSPAPACVSERKRAANRANAAKSTGPRTDAGKRASSLNAVTHGLTAQTALLRGEDAAELEALAREMLAAHRPASGVERILVERIIAIAWKLRRVAATEAELLEQHDDSHQRWAKEVRPYRAMGMRLPLEHGPATAAEFLADALGGLAKSLLMRLADYEARLHGQLMSAVRALERAEKARADRGEADELDVEDERPVDVPNACAAAAAAAQIEPTATDGGADVSVAQIEATGSAGDGGTNNAASTAPDEKRATPQNEANEPVRDVCDASGGEPLT